MRLGQKIRETMRVEYGSGAVVLVEVVLDTQKLLHLVAKARESTKKTSSASCGALVVRVKEVPK